MGIVPMPGSAGGTEPSTGATAISWPHHKGESLNLTIPERKAFAEVAVKVVAKRIPVSIHVSALSLEDSLDLVVHSESS